MPADDWDFLDSTKEYENKYFDVTRHDVEQPSGSDGTYYRVGFGDGAIAVGEHDGDVLFVDMYRPRLDEQTVELPGGGIEPGETPEEAAMREMEEETGYRAGEVSYLGSAYFIAWSPGKQHFCWLDDLERISDPGAEDEEVEGVRRVPVEEVWDFVMGDTLGQWNLTAITLAVREGYLDAPEL